MDPRVLETIASFHSRVSTYPQTAPQPIQITLPVLLVILFSVNQSFLFKTVDLFPVPFSCYKFQSVPLNFILYFYPIDWNSICFVVFKCTSRGFQPSNSLLISSIIEFSVFHTKVCLLNVRGVQACSQGQAQHSSQRLSLKKVRL